MLLQHFKRYNEDYYCPENHIGNVSGNGLRLSNIAAMVNDMRAEGKNVLLVDAGDEIQGDIYGYSCGCSVLSKKRHRASFDKEMY